MLERVVLDKPNILPMMAGCWLDETNHGWRISLAVINWASAAGMYLPASDQAYMDCHEHESRCDDYNTTGACSCAEAVSEICRDAISWLNERAPDGYSFGFWDGSFFMQTDEWWEEFSG